MSIAQVAPEPSVSPAYPSSGPNDMPRVADIDAARDAESNRSASNLNANHSSDSPTTDSTALPRTDERKDQYSLRL